MRISAAAKAETRARIVAVAAGAFTSRGYAETTTREIAREARIAAGTLFNYFPSKEALATALVADALNAAEERYRARRHGGESLAEDLFAHVAEGLRALASYRGFVAEVLTSSLGPFTRGGAGVTVRLAHLETVAGLLAQHGIGDPGDVVSTHLYWTLYLGVLAFWAEDDSPSQEDTLVLLDQSTRLFVDSLRRDGRTPEVHDAQ